jgi:hypothetical protein
VREAQPGESLIDDGMRQGLLDGFPNDIPLTVLAGDTTYYAYAATRRPNLTILPLAAVANALPAIADTNIIVDGLAALADPGALMRDLLRVTAGARVFALVSNGAFGADLLNFLAGDAWAGSHPLVAADIDALFADTGWRAVDRIPLIDRSVTRGPIPYTVSNRGITLKVTTPEIAERLSTAGFVVIVDPQ